MRISLLILILMLAFLRKFNLHSIIRLIIISTMVYNPIINDSINLNRRIYLRIIIHSKNLWNRFHNISDYARCTKIFSNFCSIKLLSSWCQRHFPTKMETIKLNIPFLLDILSLKAFLSLLSCERSLVQFETTRS